MKFHRIVLAAFSLFCIAHGQAWAQSNGDSMPVVPWPATDALGRTLPEADEVGLPKQNRYVGMFYFLWHIPDDEAHSEVYDITKILAADPKAIQNPKSPLWGPMWATHHWGESIFGYYRNDDVSVLRKHAQMLSDAGVDFIAFDATNQLTYPKSWQALCRLFAQVRSEGNRTPQIVFLCPFGEPAHVVDELWEQLYGKDLYSDLWFRWEGKPLILADPALVARKVLIRTEHPAAIELVPGHTLGQTFSIDRATTSIGVNVATWNTQNSAVTISVYQNDPHGKRLASQRLEKIVDNRWCMLKSDAPLSPGKYYVELSAPKGRVGWYSEAKDNYPAGTAYGDGAAVDGDRALLVTEDDPRAQQIRNFFTYRKPQPDYFQGPTGPNQWGWLEVFPQHAFYTKDKPNVAEEVTVGIAQNAAYGKLGVFSNPDAHGRSFHDGKQPSPNEQDTTGRNFAEQWKRAFELQPPVVFVTGWNEWWASRMNAESLPLPKAGPVAFCDQFSAEYSRDIEPMRGGHGDNYYYQLVSNVRRFKGVRPVPPVRPQPIAIDGKFDDWRDVQPEYRDTIGDPVHRDCAGYGSKLHYTNQTGRNDIVAAKVSFDQQNVYFYVRTREKLTPSTDANWMLLYLDVDGNSKTGWLGYDIVVNRSRKDENTASLERNVDGKYAWSPAGSVSYRAAGNELELAIPRELLQANDSATKVHFKWADNIQQTGDWSDFTLNGDVAPNDRFNYSATVK